jgi:hypothetical protein
MNKLLDDETKHANGEGPGRPRVVAVCIIKAISICPCSFKTIADELVGRAGDLFRLSENQGAEHIVMVRLRHRHALDFGCDAVECSQVLHAVLRPQAQRKRGHVFFRWIRFVRPPFWALRAVSIPPIAVRVAVECARATESSIIGLHLVVVCYHSLPDESERASKIEQLARPVAAGHGSELAHGEGLVQLTWWSERGGKSTLSEEATTRTQGVPVVKEERANGLQGKPEHLVL